MTKISKKIKLKALLEYFQGGIAKRMVAKKYGIQPKTMSMLIYAYSCHGAKVILDAQKVTPEFRVKVARWAITKNTLLTEVAAEFGCLGTAKILTWKKIYRQKGPNGLSIIGENTPTSTSGG